MMLTGELINNEQKTCASSLPNLDVLHACMHHPTKGGHVIGDVEYHPVWVIHLT